MSLLLLGSVFVGIVVLILLLTGGKKDLNLVLALTLLAGLILIIFGVSMMPETGLPVSKIEPGVYKVGFVYQAGENVSVGIEKPAGKVENLFLYQFPAKDFDGQVRPDAKELTAYKLTTDKGTFNRYKLE